jgi:hypothetical protein
MAMSCAYGSVTDRRATSTSKRTSFGPVFEPLRDLAVFRQVAVHQQLGTIVWPTSADMDPDVLRGVKPPV